MPRPRNFDEAEVLEGALALFREQGYEGTSVPQISERLGISRQSLYNTFGDKRGLYLRALERSGKEEVDTKLALLEADGSPLENVRTVIRGFAAKAAQCPSRGCLTVTAMVENRDDPEALAVVAEQVARLEQGYGETLVRAQRVGELDDEVRPARLAHILTTTCYGIDLLIRLPNSSQRIADAVSVLLELLDEAAA